AITRHCFLLFKCEDRVIQPTEDVFASEGDTVTLDCQFETSTTLYLFWYRQEMGDFPKYMWKGSGGFSENAPGISIERYKAAINGTSVPLTIQKLQLTDSAVYYCALRPKVTGNTTTLNIRPNNSAPTHTSSSFTAPHLCKCGRTHNGLQLKTTQRLFSLEEHYSSVSVTTHIKL
uniref:Ig-like domain-containing protein n=1 Tax=Labrus bergylta TaxID=56723 RepID=A0A3Q3F4H0_9LABR